MLIPKINTVTAITQWNFFILSSLTGSFLSLSQLQGTSIVNKRTQRESRTMPNRIGHFFNHLEWMKHALAGNFVQIWPRLRTLGVWSTLRLSHLLLEFRHTRRICQVAV